MLKIGIIGSGDIVQKAYLPVLSSCAVDLHFYARNENRQIELAQQYGITNLHRSLESLMNSGIKAAMVHTSTASHYEIILQLLTNNIHVYVDKPVTFHLETTAELFSLAKSKSLQLMVGFNRRYAPAYQKLRELSDANMIIMQKNRKALPDETRKFIVEDFIHVVDTLLYLFPHPIENLIVNGRKEKGLLYHVVVQFESANGSSAIGIMNRDSGTVEEKVEVFTPMDKWVVNNVTETIIYRDKNEMKLGENDWESTLYKRGFDNIIEEFLSGLQQGASPQHPDPLITHRICEEIVNQLMG
jgi:virulence factor